MNQRNIAIRRDTMAGPYKFRTKCGMEYETTDYLGKVWIASKVLEVQKADEEFLKKYSVSKSDKCNECTLNPKLGEEVVHICNPADRKDSIDTEFTYCYGELISHPYPVICPITGEEFVRLAYSDIDDEIVPLYRHGKKLRTAFFMEKEDYEDANLELYYRIVKKIYDDDTIEFESGMYAHKDSIGAIVKCIEDARGLIDLNPVGAKTLLSSLANLFSSLKKSDEYSLDLDDKEEDDE
jgi:hypothetical protein